VTAISEVLKAEANLDLGLASERSMEQTWILDGISGSYECKYFNVSIEINLQFGNKLFQS